ncbi:MAG: hypothetical protein FWF78_02820 [Defluviitaleaceae bacterium]|nr:hypothetical protein [Defluviitaleaceae bacterium]
MINSAITNTNPIINGLNLRRDSKPPEPPTDTVEERELPNSEALVTIFQMDIPGGRMTDITVRRADSFSMRDPVMLVNGVDVCGTPFTREVRINDIDPRNATFIEMLALDGYLVANGKPSGIARLAASAMASQYANPHSGLNGSDTQYNFLSIIDNHLSSIRANGSLNAYFALRPILDSLTGFAARNN